MSISIRVLSVIIILLFRTFGFGKDLALNLAERLFESGNHEEAITEYKRFIFFNTASDSVSYAYYKIGLAYCNEKKCSESTDALRQSIQTAPTDSIRNERKIDLAIVLIACGKYSAAKFQLLRVESFSRFPKLKRKAAFFRGIASLYSFNWNEAKDAFQVFGVSAQVDSLLSEAKDLNYKSPALAKLLSSFLPGTGQIYACSWQDGINALAINTGTGYFLFSSLIDGEYRNTILIYSFLFQRYYLGNRNNAEKVAKEHNQRLNNRYADRILKIILSNSY